MFSQRANRRAFRPSLDTQPLEERVVLNGAGAQQLQASVQSGMSAAQVRQAYRAQLRTITNDLRTAVNNQINTLYANGQQPTAGQLGEFREQLDGIINANVIRLSSSASLLPNANNRLVPSIQRAFLKDTNGGILNQLTRIIDSPGRTRNAQALTRAVNNQLNRALNQTTGVYNSYFANAGLNRNSVDASGQRIGLQQYLGNQVITQYGNNLGSLAAGFGGVANTSLFPDGALESTTAGRTSFATQYTNALNTIGYQLGSNLSLFPGLSSTVGQDLQSSLFDVNSGSGSLINTLDTLPRTSIDFTGALTPAFQNAFNTTSSTLSNGFGLPGTQTFSLPTSNFTNAIGPNFTNFGNGFNSGFGSGFVGFGTTTDASYNPAFGAGFNSTVSNFVPGRDGLIGSPDPSTPAGSGRLLLF